MACGWCAQYAILTEENLLYSVCCGNLGNQLNDFWIVETSIAPNNEKAAFHALWN